MIIPSKEEIRAFAEPLIADGYDSVSLRAEIYRRFGIGIGGGGGGGALGDGPVERCPYCDASGNGGHGGFCPNGTT